MSKISCTILSILLLAPLAASAGMYKWVDEKGVTQYGDVIPPQYAGQGNIEFSKRGLPIKKTDPAPTPEQIEQRGVKQQLQKEQDQVKLEQRRKDMALLNTYSSVEEIDLTRDRHVTQAELVIRSTETRLKPVDVRLLDLTKQSNAQLRSGKPLSPALKKNLEQAKTESRGLHSMIEQKRAESQAIRSKFENDKKRFIELNQLAGR